MTSCVCNGPGFCERHNVQKNETWYQLCRMDDRYFQAWEDGRGPGHHISPLRSKPKGVGGHLRSALGCGAKGWQRYREMDRLGEGCIDIIDELAASLVAGGYVTQETAAIRLLKTAITKGRKHAD